MMPTGHGMPRLRNAGGRMRLRRRLAAVYEPIERQLRFAARHAGTYTPAPISSRCSAYLSGYFFSSPSPRLSFITQLAQLLDASFRHFRLMKIRNT